ncbi:hypothetical protein SMICM304S_03629 [Streptomyces microflavus]
MSRVSKPYEIVERALELSTTDGLVVIADEHSSANLRWAGNALTTNGVTRGGPSPSSRPWTGRRAPRPVWCPGPP